MEWKINVWMYTHLCFYLALFIITIFRLVKMRYLKTRFFFSFFLSPSLVLSCDKRKKCTEFPGEINWNDKEWYNKFRWEIAGVSDKSDEYLYAEHMTKYLPGVEFLFPSFAFSFDSTLNFTVKIVHFIWDTLDDNKKEFTLWIDHTTFCRWILSFFVSSTRFHIDGWPRNEGKRIERTGEWQKLKTELWDTHKKWKNSVCNAIVRHLATWINKLHLSWFPSHFPYLVIIYFSNNKIYGFAVAHRSLCVLASYCLLTILSFRAHGLFFYRHMKWYWIVQGAQRWRGGYFKNGMHKWDAGRKGTVREGR